MKVVLDTNVFVAALRSRQGASNALLQLLFNNHSFTNCVSVGSVLELEAVLLRDEHRGAYPQFSTEDLHRFVDAICRVSTQVNLYFRWRPSLRDPGDDLIIETALNGSAQAVVTHNTSDFLPVKTQHGLQVWTPAEFLQQILST